MNEEKEVNIEITDQIGVTLKSSKVPQRIVCLVPSLTEFLFDLGLEEQIVGITKFCKYPASKVKKKTKIGGTKKLNFDVINELSPDLIIACKEENTKDQIKQLQKQYKVFTANICDFNSALEALEKIGHITGKRDQAIQIIASIRLQKDQYPPSLDRLKVGYLIWEKPYMTVGGDTFINSMLEFAGYKNIFKNRNRYPSISLAQIKSLNADIVFLSSEPFPFTEKHIEEISNEIGIHVVLVNGEFFSWYGSKMLFAYKYFDELRNTINEECDI